MESFGEPEEQVTIAVLDPEQKTELGGANTFIVYALSGTDGRGKIEAKRRYSQFHTLREIFVKRWPGCFVPSLPEKKTIGNNEMPFIQSRRKALEGFLVVLSRSPPLWDSEEMQQFLRGSSCPTPVKEGIEKVAARYEALFQHYKRSEVTAEFQGKIMQFANSMRQILTMLDSLSGMMEKTLAHVRKFSEKFMAMVEVLLPSYESNCLFLFEFHHKHEGLLFANASQNGIADAFAKMKMLLKEPPVSQIYEQVKLEKREIMAFQEAIKETESLEQDKQRAVSKVRSLELEANLIEIGKSSFFSKLTNKPKEVALKEKKEEIEKAGMELRAFQSVSRLASLILCCSQIDKFKTQRQKNYYSLLKSYCVFEKEICVMEKDLWACVGRHELISIRPHIKLLSVEQIQKESFDRYEGAGTVTTIRQEREEEEVAHETPLSNPKDQQITFDQDDL